MRNITKCGPCYLSEKGGQRGISGSFTLKSVFVFFFLAGTCEAGVRHDLTIYQIYRDTQINGAVRGRDGAAAAQE